MRHTSCSMRGLEFSGGAIDKHPINRNNIFTVVRYVPWFANKEKPANLTLYVSDGIEEAERVDLECTFDDPNLR